jgi:hypothetical protein
VSEAAVVSVLSAEDVGWMMRAIRDAQERIAEEHATHAKYFDRLEAETQQVIEAEARATKEDHAKIAYLTSQLEAHLLNKRAADPSVKSIRTPWGEVSSREQQPDYQRDEGVLLGWASVNAAVRYHAETVVDWELLKKRCHVTGDHLVTPEGEIVPGVTVVERPLKVTVKCEP